MMRMNVYMCLSAFILSCRVCAEEVHMAVMETSSVSLPCSYIMDNSMTWTKQVDGRLDFLFSVIGDEERRENDPEERFSSVGYNSLHINRVYLSDSGKYMCNNHWSVELTVIPTGTFIQHAREGTSVTLTCPHVTGSYPEWRRESDGWRPHPGLTLTLTDLRLSDSGLYSCDGKPAVYLNVTTGDDEAPPTTTDTKTTSTSATTTATTQKKTTSKTNNSKKGTKPEKKDKDTVKTKPTPVENTGTTTTKHTKDEEKMVPMAVMEMSSVSLPCSNIMDNRMTWDKQVDGRFDFLFSVIGDEERRGNDPEERFSSVGYNSLHINRVYLSDSGKYICNSHWSVELTVIPTGTFIQHAREGTSVTLTCPHVTGSYDPIWRRESDGWRPRPGLTLNLTLPELKPIYSGLFSCDGKPAVYLNVTTGDDEAPPTTTDTKTTSTSATTTATTQKKTTSKTNNSKKGTKPEKKGGKKTKPTKKPEVKPTTTASITVTKGGSDKNTPPSPSVPRPTNSPKTPIKSTPRMVTASTQTKDDAPEHLPPHFGLVYRVMLVFVLIFFVLCFSFRLWFIKRGVKSSTGVTTEYDMTDLRGVKRSREGTTEYDTVNITGDAAENDSMDDDITDLHISENMTDTI
ncbi:uncharacterized protein LOC115428218 isoform X2 [Sphaeramia orbicularis]|uniref:uncharacterized protein LOC115428218 isoform X2 n=1 Tax=Sphaeramia orbicularis TaxID=375764 RepID=UPI00117EE2AB|nr:uncharacterized protein LOC115428218 isoform X2 [Sphaeramia orbicularis]